MEEYHSHDYTRSTCFYTQPWKNLFKDFNLEMEWEVTSAIIHNEIWTVPCFKGVWVDFFHSVFSFSSSRLFIFFILSFYTDGFPSFASLLLSFLSFFFIQFSPILTSFFPPTINDLVLLTPQNVFSCICCGKCLVLDITIIMWKWPEIFLIWVFWLDDIRFLAGHTRSP